jgi:uncharacterized protein (DUF3084 family)
MTIFRLWIMVSKVLVIVIVIAAIAAVCVGAFLVMNNNNDPAPLDVDEVRTELRVGDYNEFR